MINGSGENENINTREYWEKRFDTDWELMQGREQTLFFAEIALGLLPMWIKNEIRENKLSICDFGCAEGQAVDYFAHIFQTEVLGTDFSESALEKCRRSFPNCRFFQSDITKKNMDIPSSDVGYISNVLEHICKPWEVAENIVQTVRKYFIIMVPFRETMVVEEHCNKFDLNNIPLKINDFTLVFANYEDCAELEGTLYADNQILLVYEKTSNLEGRTLDNFILGFDETLRRKLFQREQKIDELQGALQKEVDELEVLGKKNQQLQKKNEEIIIQMQEEKTHYQQRKFNGRKSSRILERCFSHTLASAVLWLLRQAHIYINISGRI
mgnify:CR=1 FL=1